MDVVLVPMMLARPHLLAWPLTALWLWLMLRARERDRAPPLLAALLMTVWANLHGSFVFGLGIAAAFGLEALIASPDRARALRQWLLFGIACAIAVCVNANGIEGALHPLRFTQLQMLPMIAEWKPSSPTATPFFFGVLALVLALIAWKRPRLHPVRLAADLRRSSLAPCSRRGTRRCWRSSRRCCCRKVSRAVSSVLPKATARTAAMLALAGALLIVAIRAIVPVTLPDSQTNPWKLIASVPPELRSKPVLNDYSMGGPLILSGIRTFVDGRGDMYGDPMILRYARITNGDRRAFDDAVQRWDIRWAIVPHGDTGIVHLLDHTPGWRKIRSDAVGVVYARS